MGRVLLVAVLLVAPRAVLAHKGAPGAVGGPGAPGAGAAPAATLVVRVAGDGVPAWQADAIARTAARDLTGDRLRGAFADIDRAACAAADTVCAIAAHRAAGVDIAITAEVSGGLLRYEVLLTWPGASPPVRRGSAALPEPGRAGLAAALRAALHPVTRPGGALDTRGSAARAGRPALAATPAADEIWLAALAAALLLLAPLAFGALLLGRGGLVAALRTRALRRVLVALAALAAAAYSATEAGELVRAWSWAVFLAGGLAWGALAAALLPVMCPPLLGLGRVEHAELFRVVRAWLLLAVRRSVGVALFYAPFALALWAACAAAGIAAQLAVLVVAPFWGLAARLAHRSLVEVVALRLDADLVDSAGDAAGDAWDEAARGYLLAYARRAGWPDADRLLRGIRVLPGRGREVTLYGGGLTHTRVVVGRELLELALAPPGRPHDYALPRVSKLHWTEW
ncbi:MAG TPA: hypothetical protein VKB80_02015, partial [Kofleriaceae bacterium]|nr:hypothetical protein [Kofleriaceae bacterium]